MKRKITAVAILIVVITGLATASSFTTATLSRDANINVVSDSEGVIALVDGNSGGVVTEKGNGELSIDFRVGSADGVNIDSVYELGNSSNPSYRAFNITNQDSVSHDIELNYSLNNDDGNNQDNVEFQVYDASGSSVVTASEETGAVTVPSAASGESYAVVVIVDTTIGGLSDGDDLSGTLRITAT